MKLDPLCDNYCRIRIYKGDSRSEAGMTSKASAARMSILILIAEPQQSGHEVE